MGDLSHRALICGLTIALLLTGCSFWPQPSSTPSTVPAGPVVAGRTEVEGVNGVVPGLSISDVALGAKVMHSLSDWGDFPIAAGRPSEIRINGAVPPEGLRLTRRYNRPLPSDATATFAYFNQTLDSWIAVPSEVASDHLSVSAVVHHLSLWSDFVSGTQQAMKAFEDAATGAADWAYYSVGKVFDTRVDPPQCSSKEPEWVEEATFIETHRNNSILFCVGEDEAKPGILTIKARVNRGYGFTAETATKPTWTYNSSFEHNDLEEAWAALADLDKALGNSMRNITADGRMTSPGQEFSIGLSETEARKQATNLALKMTPQSILPFLITTLGQLVGTDMASKADGYVAAIMATAKCSKDVSAATNAASLTKAAISCLAGIDETLARQLAMYLLKRGMKNPGKVAGKIVGKASMYLAVIGPVFNALNYWAEQGLAEDARTVHVFPSVVKVLLAPRRVGSFAFGTPYQTVKQSLRRLLGKPTAIYEDEGCPMNPIWSRTLLWKGFWVQFEANQPTKTDHMDLSHWGINNDKGLPAGVRTVDSLPVRTTFRALKRSYPGIRIVDMFGTGAGPYLTELRNDSSYIWVDSRGSAVAEVQSGPVRGCE